MRFRSDMTQLAAIALVLIATPAMAVEPVGLDCIAIDGDTFRCDDMRVRLWGIDTPERGEACADEATAALQAMLSTGNVACRVPPSGQDTDRFGRLVRQCWVDDRDVAAELVSAGLARDWRRFSGGEYADEQASATPCR